MSSDKPHFFAILRQGGWGIPAVMITICMECKLCFHDIDH